MDIAVDDVPPSDDIVDGTSKTFKDSPQMFRRGVTFDETADKKPWSLDHHIEIPADIELSSSNHGVTVVSGSTNERARVEKNDGDSSTENVQIRHCPIGEAKQCTCREGERRNAPHFNIELQPTVTTHTQIPHNEESLCRCHHTHHHHHHHTIVIRGLAETSVQQNPVGDRRAQIHTKSARRLNVMKTKSCPSWADGSCKNGRPVDNVRNSSPDVEFSQLHCPGNLCATSPTANGNANNVARRTCPEHGDQDQARAQYRYQTATGKRKKCCQTFSPAMVATITVLIIVILGLLSGLIYFLVLGRVTTTNTEPSPPKETIPSLSTVLNQTTLCGKFPKEYLALYGRAASYAKQPTYNLHPPKNDNRINGSDLEARITGGIPASAGQYPWQGSGYQSPPLVFDDSRNVVDASMVRGRILGGSDTAATRVPWQVHLHAVSLWVTYRGMTCGGSLIMRDWVLTAAHCTEMNRDPRLWTVYMGMSRINDKSIPPAQTSKVTIVIQHQSYVNNFSYDYDVSLMKLKTEMAYSPTVQPICLPSSTAKYEEGTKCYISGWGAIDNSGEANLPDTLQRAQVDIVGHDTCTRDDWLGEFVSDRMMCAGKAGESGDACQGDSGGPLSCYDQQRKAWTLAGSVSWGLECGETQHPGVYARMPFFVDWIWKNIGVREGWIEAEIDDGHDYLEASGYQD